MIHFAREFHLVRFVDEISRHDAEDFQKRRGVNVKTNDSGCKERAAAGLKDGGGRSRKRENLGGENIRGRRGYKDGSSHPDDDNFFLFPPQLRLARSDFQLLFLPSSPPFLRPPPTRQPGSTARLHQPPRKGILERISRSGDLSLLFRVFVSVIPYRLQACVGNCETTQGRCRICARWKFRLLFSLLSLAS